MWVGNYVLMTYGEGAVMGVPGHDERDFGFALKYGLPIKFVIRPGRRGRRERSPTSEWRRSTPAYGVCINSGKYDGLDYQAAVDAIAADLQAKGLGEKQVQWRLRDWGISRQRYWGCPIPLIHVPDSAATCRCRTRICRSCCRKAWCRTAPAIRSTRRLRSTSASARSAAATRGARRTRWTRSSIRRGTSCASPCADDDRAMVDERADYWMPVDQYIGGIEHAILHLLYSRFWMRVMRDMGLIKVKEPFARLLTQGMVLNDIYSRTQRRRARRVLPSRRRATCSSMRSGAHARRDAAQRRPAGRVGRHAHDVEVEEQRRRPDASWSSASARTACALFMMFKAPPEDTLEWSDDGVEGSARFLRRLWRMVWEHLEKGPAGQQPPRPELIVAARLRSAKCAAWRTRRSSKVTDDYGRRRVFNTAIAAVMELMNALAEVRRRSASRAAPCVTRRSS